MSRMRSVTLDNVQTTEYPANFHPEMIKLREANKKRRLTRELLRDDISHLNSQITSLSVELRGMKNCPGPSICEKCKIVAMVWQQIPACKHIFCHSCLTKNRNQRQKELQETENKKWEKKEREMISWRKPKVAEITDDICLICPN